MKRKKLNRASVCPVHGLIQTYRRNQQALTHCVVRVGAGLECGQEVKHYKRIK